MISLFQLMQEGQNAIKALGKWTELKQELLQQALPNGCELENFQSILLLNCLHFGLCSAASQKRLCFE